MPGKKHLKEITEELSTKQLQGSSRKVRRPSRQRNARSCRSSKRSISSEKARQSRYSKSEHFEERVSKFKPYKLPNWQKGSESRRRDSTVHW